MIPTEILSALKAYALSKETLPVAATDPAAGQGQGGATPFEQGQRLQGVVLSEISPGLFKVRVANQLVQMKLPALLHTGDTVEFQVVSLQPRLTFSMVVSNNPLSTSQQLSTTARMLSALSQQQPEKAQVRAALKPPLVTTEEPPRTQPLANLLREAINNSGLFYESHQVQWLEGGRATAQLLQEPQNQPASVAIPANHPTAPAGRQKIVETNARGVNEPPSIADNIATRGGPSGQSAQTESIPIPTHLQALVQQQLSALETGRILWQGQVFPNQTLQWEIWQQSGQEKTAASEQERSWATSLQLDLPSLGSVNAQMRLSGNGSVSLTLDAASPETRKLLGSASSKLVSALNEAGLKVNSALVVQHESP